MKAGVVDENLIKYLPRMAELAFKGLIYGIKNKKSICKFNLQELQNAEI